MKVDIYKTASTRVWSFLTVPAGSDLNEINLPKDLPWDFNVLKHFEKGVDITRDQPRAGFDVADIVKQITEQGYALHRTDISVQTHTRPN